MVETPDHIGRSARLTVGIDLDGVLGDQIADVLPRIKQRLGIELAPDEITEFRLPLGTTNLSEEIVEAQHDANYLLTMPAHPGGVELVNALRTRHRVLLITARPAALRSVTAQWLQIQGLVFDGVVNALEEQKSVYGADVLIDDYTRNIREFLEKSSGLGVLVDRPWNRQDRKELAPWRRTGRLAIASSLDSIAHTVNDFSKRKQPSNSR
jgi:5'(3')-deoxyribonucleotidase